MNKKTRNILIIVVAALVVLSCVFMFIISPISIKKGNREMPEADMATDEILTNIVVEQKFKNITEDINEVAVVFDRLYLLDEKTYIVIELLDGENILAQNKYVADEIRGDHRTYLTIDTPISGYVGKELSLKIYTTSTAGTGLALMMNSKESGSSFMFGNKNIKGTICFSVVGKE